MNDIINSADTWEDGKQLNTVLKGILETVDNHVWDSDFDSAAVLRLQSALRALHTANQQRAKSLKR